MPQINKPTFSEVDAAYRSAIEAPGRELKAAFTAARQLSVTLDSDEITRAVLLRLRSFFLTQDLIKEELKKRYATPAADFFVETVVFFLCVALDKLAPNLEVASEKGIMQKAGAMRPDITVWKDGQVIAAVECKTQLGWNRNGWLNDFENREKRLQKVYSNAKLLLLVMTGSNWAGFGPDERTGKQFFVLLREIWPRKFNEETSHLVIMNRFEELVGAIVTHAEPNE